MRRRRSIAEIQKLFYRLLFALQSSEIDCELSLLSTELGIIIVSKRFRKYLLWITYDGYFVDHATLETLKVACSVLKVVPLIVALKFRHEQITTGILHMKQGIFVISEKTLLDHLFAERNPFIIRTTGGDISRLNRVMLQQLVRENYDLLRMLMVSKATLKHYLREELVFVDTSRLKRIQRQYHLNLSMEIDLFLASVLLLQQQLFYTNRADLNQHLLHLLLELHSLQDAGVWLSGRAPD